MSKIYSDIHKAEFISRPNRFIAMCRLNGEEITVHVKNTGRCRELLVPGARVLLEKSKNPNRKTLYDLVAVMKGNTLINMDSYAPNLAAGKWLRSGGLFDDVTLVKSEAVFENSRFDFYVERSGGEKLFLEVKGVTLEKGGVAMFPDAPTLRGVKHLNELVRCTEKGIGAYILFVIQMDGISCFMPNAETHPEFAEALSNAAAAGVHVLAYDCDVAEDDMNIRRPVKIKLV